MDKHEALEALEKAHKLRKHADRIEREAHAILDKREEGHEATASVPVSRSKLGTGHAYLVGLHEAAAKYHKKHADHNAYLAQERPASHVHADAARIHSAQQHKHIQEAKKHLVRAEHYVGSRKGDHARFYGRKTASKGALHIESKIRAVHKVLGTTPFDREADHVHSNKDILRSASNNLGGK